ncbi:MAG TPA: SPOR domain-containing protein [Candidatus Limnocylindrales bacterium]|nr:SPOR domain-containing protein [Candidatus Limnocylindrales bacterium]
MLIAATVFACAFVPALAAAQTGAGAERYEVTITPPKRPGSEPAAAAPVEPANDGAGAPTAAAPAAAGEAAKQGTATAATANASAAVAPVAPEVPALPVGPLRTLQVGAFRQQKSAVSLHDTLVEAFQDVVVVEAQSGGEPIYRVNVGRLPRGPALDDLKRRLVAAGYPTFEVLAPVGESAPH